MARKQLDKVSVCVPYGPLKPKQVYYPVKYTIDACVIRNNGKVIYVPIDLIVEPPKEQYIEELNYDDVINSNYF